MPNIFFTADTHFGHSRIIDYCKRPFPQHHEMNEAILERFNSVLRPGDLLYHLGDIAWSSFPVQTGFLDRLSTKEVHLVLGNHDTEKTLRECSFRAIHTRKNLFLDKTSVVLDHYALRTWVGKGRGAFQLYGHSHGTLPGIGRQLDVGVDTHNFYPWEWSEIKDLLKDIPFKDYE